MFSIAGSSHRTERAAALPRRMRKTLALTIVLLITSVAPATAVIGFCARMPCCEHESGAAPQPVLTTENGDCCTTINCYEAPSHKLTAKDTVKVSFDAVPMLTVAATLTPRPAHRVGAFADTSPPKTARQRLAALSTLLI